MNIDKGLIRHWAMLFESGYGLSEDEVEMHEAKKTQYVDGEGNKYSFRDDDDDDEQMRRDSNVKNSLKTARERVEGREKLDRFPDLTRNLLLYILRMILVIGWNDIKDEKSQNKKLNDRQKLFTLIDMWAEHGDSSESDKKHHVKSDYEQIAKQLRRYLSRVDGHTDLSYRYGDDVYESGNDGGVSGGFSDEELKTMYHNEWTFFDLKNEKMYGSDEFFLLMMYGFYDNFFLSDSEKDVQARECIQKFFDAIGREEWPACDHNDKDGKAYKSWILDKGNEKDFYQFLRDYARTDMTSPYGRNVEDPQFVLFENGGDCHWTSFADFEEAHEFLGEHMYSDPPAYDVSIGAESTGEVVHVYEGDSLEDAKSAVDELLGKYGEDKGNAYFNFLALRDWKDGRENNTHKVYIPKEIGQNMGYSSKEEL